MRKSFIAEAAESTPPHDIQVGSTPEADDLSDGVPESQSAPILKPDGEVTRIARGGYALLDALGWKEDHYDQVQASKT